MKTVKSPKTAAEKVVKKAPRKVAANPAVDADQLLLQNITAITMEIQGLTKAVDDHVLKTINIANHVVALEAVLAEVVALTGLDMVKVNSRIRSKVSTASEQPEAADFAIDLAASIVAPSPRI